MSVLDRLAKALERNDERPNVELAEDIVARSDSNAVRVLVEALKSSPVAIRNDALKALHEVGLRKPALIAPHLEAFLALLPSRKNRTVWGSLQAIESIAPERPAEVMAALAAILAAADKGSVIAKDKANGILVRLAAAGRASALRAALDRLPEAAPNQFPTYAEQIGEVAGGADAARLATIVEKRLPRVAGAAKRARLEKLLRRLAKARTRA